ncbi:MAG: isocitrate dehydrogenase (NADP(+)) [Sulfurimonas sp. RIFOXYD12_FULL_33_39]|uniref:NADP-dependent isocitrate dehydrogenase n=1 Tax=unclassified Sulfurimonas TaxID=2623549 RepID=UPI0008B3DBD6|nr:MULTISPECIES: NADP-dependent isocitrate dehydrogenase [unclassified Sulfurimonas]OHE04138.1 MAG: isocitrate dehydrogenase (NADP(+)) [Sulfurimonas sp. RIFCSPLOWO2_12_FULL_34_6]OHE09355.1 MAG: isocitrate dehydrogenase (NADP(+)) [Sulfurimonas sp. RIFOXYD12_FULL_33_39]OHE12862.1 MAG: isocitrate dehydrogenase (NADP(+)) [Sulfurimonas sp. RIFOXYD2_FULL_34_21]
MSKIIWSKIDEAPALATYSLLPIVNAFTKAAGVDVETRDISLAGRVIATFPEYLTDEQKIADELAYLGRVVQEVDGNIIKLPNISASVPQLKECIAELQSQGYKLPDFPESPKTAEEEAIKEKYSTCLGSAVNPVLREGNSDRRAAVAVKNFAKKNPHKLRAFSENSKTYVSHMSSGDFYENEQSVIKSGDGAVRIELNGKLLKEIKAVDKEVLDGTFLSAKALRKFLQETLVEAKEKGVLWSIHLKATMMKVSDPIMFGHAVEVFFKDVFEKYAADFKEIGYNSNLGLGDLYKKLEKLPADKKAEIEKAIMDVYTTQPNIAMVDSDKGITNLHASNDVIIDASMPVVVRDGGKMWNAKGEVQECVSVIPDRCYATMYKECVDDCVKNGQFDVTTMGSVSNVGLMAQKAEEYGSHPTTFEIAEDGVVKVLDTNGSELMSFNVEKGDIWRMSRAKDIPIKDWVRLAVERARLTNTPVVFWLDEKRAHDANMIKKVNEYLKDFDTSGLTIEIMAPEKAMAYSLKRVRIGLDTISATGNVLRDYLTDLFPILELGTSAKMLSIVPLLAGGGLFETGAGGSAPKHVDQFLEEGHLRWDSLGEFLALAESLRFIAQKNSSKELEVVTYALDIANQAYLDNNKAPGRKAGEPDNKASHFFVAQYWANALAAQKDDAALAAKFAPVAKALVENEAKIMEELLAVEGKPQNIGGYYHPDDAKASAAMRPSATLNAIIDSI